MGRVCVVSGVCVGFHLTAADVDTRHLLLPVRVLPVAILLQTLVEGASREARLDREPHLGTWYAGDSIAVSVYDE